MKTATSRRTRASTSTRAAAPLLDTSCIEASFGLKGQTTSQIIAAIHAGFSYGAIASFQKFTNLPIEMITGLVRIPPRTLTRRKAEGRLSPDESERLFRVARVVEKTVDLFEGDRAAAMQWLQSPQPALAGAKPLDFVHTEVGAREVEDLIGRLEHGVFT